MKKTILALFLLLFILIVTCAYEKSHTIYAKTAKEHTSPVHNTEIASVAVVEKHVKEKIIAAKVIGKKIENKTAVESKLTPSTQTEKNIPSPVTTESTEIKEEEKTLLSKLKSAVMKKLHSDEQATKNKPLDHHKPIAVKNDNTVKQNITHNTSEEEIVDHLVWALKNQDLALKNRDKLELEIEALIKRALEDRFTAIENRKKGLLALERAQKALLAERDQRSKKIPQPYTINPGE